MADDYRDLIERLRDENWYVSIMHEAADAIEALVAENAALKLDLAAERSEHNVTAMQRGKAQEEVAALRAWKLKVLEKRAIGVSASTRLDLIERPEP